jgi:hypothetical protein
MSLCLLYSGSDFAKNNTHKGIARFINQLEIINPRGDCWLVSSYITMFNMFTNMSINELLIEVRHAFEKFYKLYYLFEFQYPHLIWVKDMRSLKNSELKDKLNGSMHLNTCAMHRSSKTKCCQTPVLAIVFCGSFKLFQQAIILQILYTFLNQCFDY